MACRMRAAIAPSSTGLQRSQVIRRKHLARVRHDGCDGLAGSAELLSGADGLSSRPVLRIVLRE